MSLINLSYVFSVGNTIISSQHNTNNSTIYNDYNGNINDANISSSAGIEYTKLSLLGSIRQSDIISTFNTSSGFGFIPSGGIIMWSGSIASIPSGWSLCNGSNGTPDLRNKFVVCADADVTGVANSTISGSAEQSGGSTTITINQMPAHTHTIKSTGGAGTGYSSAGFSSLSDTTGSTGSGLPYTQPYFALAYIMKS